jgi:hypothetical protein
MNDYTDQTAPTQFVETNGIRFAYRRFGKKESVPLVFNPHILGNLDSWDPAVTDGLAQAARSSFSTIAALEVRAVRSLKRLPGWRRMLDCSLMGL